MTLQFALCNLHFAIFILKCCIHAALRLPFVNTRRLVKLILKYHCHLKAKTTNTKGYKRSARCG